MLFVCYCYLIIVIIILFSSVWILHTALYYQASQWRRWFPYVREEALRENGESLRHDACIYLYDTACQFCLKPWQNVARDTGFDCWLSLVQRLGKTEVPLEISPHGKYSIKVWAVNSCQVIPQTHVSHVLVGWGHESQWKSGGNQADSLCSWIQQIQQQIPSTISRYWQYVLVSRKNSEKQGWAKLSWIQLLHWRIFLCKPAPRLSSYICKACNYESELRMELCWGSVYWNLLRRRGRCS